MNIKESKELIAGIELLAVSGLEIAKDGIDVSDLSKVIELVKKADVIKDAVNGINLIDDEIKDLDQAELLELGVASFTMIKAIIASTKKPVVA